VSHAHELEEEGGGSLRFEVGWELRLFDAYRYKKRKLIHMITTPKTNLNILKRKKERKKEKEKKLSCFASA